MKKFILLMALLSPSLAFALPDLVCREQQSSAVLTLGSDGQMQKIMVDTLGRNGEPQKIEFKKSDGIRCRSGANKFLIDCSGGTRMSPIYIHTEIVTRQKLGSDGAETTSSQLEIHLFKGRPMPWLPSGPGNQDLKIDASFDLKNCQV